MSLAEMLAHVQNFNVGFLQPRSAEAIRAMSDDDVAEAIAALAPAARTCPDEGRLSTMPNFMPIGNVFNRTGCEELQRIAYMLGVRGAPAAVPALRALFESDRSREVRLAAGHYLLMFLGTGDEVAAASDARANELVGWFRLWVGAQIAISRSEAYVPIAARVAAATEKEPLLHAVMDAGWREAIDDVRWGELARQTLAVFPDHDMAMSVVANVKDTSSIPFLVARAANPDFNTARMALGKLAQLLDGDALFAAIEPVYRVTTQKRMFEDLFVAKKLARGVALVEARERERDARIAALEFPFAFHGAGDVHENYDLGSLRYVVRFAGTLDAKAKQALAVALAEEPAAVEMSTVPWQWIEHDGDTWATFLHEGQPMDMHFVMRTIHRVTPIRLAILDAYLDQLEVDEWTRWSQLRAPCPDAPAFPEDVDDAFERARRRDDLQDYNDEPPG